jgi:predicted nucleic-acid-binding Zn-ribbon protein
MPESTSHPVPQPSASCPECGGQCVSAEVRVSGMTFPGTVHVQRPDAFWSGTSTLRALVCSRCGLTRFYAENPAELLPKK